MLCYNPKHTPSNINVHHRYTLYKDNFCDYFICLIQFPLSMIIIIFIDEYITRLSRWLYLEYSCFCRTEKTLTLHLMKVIDCKITLEVFQTPMIYDLIIKWIRAQTFRHLLMIAQIIIFIMIKFYDYRREYNIHLSPVKTIVIITRTIW